MSDRPPFTREETGLVHEACKWCYKGVWGILASYFKMPTQAPALPTMEGETVEYLHPSIAYLNYQKFLFWIGLFIMDAIFTAMWIAFAYWWPLGGLLITPLALAIIVLPDILAYIAIHLRYDTTWYVLTDRSMRLRRGIWTLHETTITFENIQNIHLQQGPLQRYFGFSNLIVKTAGGGGAAAEGAVSLGAHVGILEGLDNAIEIRDRIMAHCKKSGTTGLGDETTAETTSPSRHTSPSIHSNLDQQSLATLREIRDITRLMVESQ